MLIAQGGGMASATSSGQPNIVIIMSDINASAPSDPAEAPAPQPRGRRRCGHHQIGPPITHIGSRI